MGCCQSTERSSVDENTPAARHASQQQTETSAARDNAALSHPTAPRSQSTTLATTARPNRPIRSPSVLNTSPSHIAQHPPPWTRSLLEREREAFFDTRVSGNREVWSGLRIVAEMLRRIPSDPIAPVQQPSEEVEEGHDPKNQTNTPEDDSNGLAAVQGLLDALNLTCPNGRIAGGRGRDRVKGGLYDERGALYELPAWVVRDPEDLIEDGTAGAAGEKEGLGAVSTTSSEDNSEDEENAQDSIRAAARRREEKGKGRAEDAGEIVALRARLSDRGSDLIVRVGTKQRLSTVVQGLQEQIGPRKIRLMYLGKVLDERTTLEDSGWQTGHVVNALVYEEESANANGAGATKSRGRKTA